MNKNKVQIPLAENLTSSNIATIEKMMEDLLPMGISVELNSTETNNYLFIEYDSDAYKRNAGRKKKNIPSSSPLNEMTQEEIDTWILSNPIEKIQKELSVGRATAFRRKAESRERIAYTVVSLENEDS